MTKESFLEGDNFFLALGTLVIMSIFIIVKKVSAKKQLEAYMELVKQEEEAKRKAEESSDEELEPEDENAVKTSCEKVPEDEYDFQSRVLTKQEIRHLVKSEAYKRLMEAKGRDPANWNWQVQDKSQGFFPMAEEDNFQGAGANEMAQRLDVF
jgi:hypothetical protein